MYDGTALTANEKCRVTRGSIASGQTLTCTNSGTITDVGETPKVLTSTSIKDSSGNSVKSNYDVTEVDGKLTITPRKITVKCDNQSKTYDGTALSADNKCTVTSGTKPVSGDTVTCTCTGSQTDVGESDKTLDSVSIPHASNYEITKNNGKLTVSKRSITVKCDDQSKTYDGTALSANNNCTVTSSTGIASGHSVTCTCSGSITSAGSTDKTIGSVSITGGGKDQSCNYNVSSQNGTLSVSAKSIEVEWGSTTSWTYDGNYHAPTASASTGVSGETIDIDRTTEKSSGTHTSTASCSSVSGGQADCDNYTLTNATKSFTIVDPGPTYYTNDYQASSCNYYYCSMYFECYEEEPEDTSYLVTKHPYTGSAWTSPESAKNGCEDYYNKFNCPIGYSKQSHSTISTGHNYYWSNGINIGGPFDDPDHAMERCKQYNDRKNITAGCHVYCRSY